MVPLKIDERLKEWATPQQAEYIDAINLHGGARAAAKALGKDKSTITRSIDSLRLRAVMAGYSPDHHMIQTVPEPFVVRGVSTYFDAEGKPRGQWVKSQLDRDKLPELMRAAAEAMSADLPRV